MMEYSMSNLNLPDSGNLNEKHIRWNEAGIATLPHASICDSVLNSVPICNGCNMDIARNFSEEDLRALNYEIPDEYLHQCLKSDYLSQKNDSISMNNVNRGPFIFGVNESVSGQSSSSCEVEKKFISGELCVGSFSVTEFMDSTGHIQKTVGYKLKERELLPTNRDCGDIYSKFDVGNARELPRNCMSPKQSPLIEIDNLINKIKVSSKTPGTFVKRRHFTNVYCKIVQLNANNSQMESMNCSDKITRLTKTKRKPRMKLTANQLIDLNEAFAKNHYLTSERSKLLSKRLGIPEICLKTWFQNRRAKYKRMNLNRRNSLNCGSSGSFSTQIYGLH